MSTSTSPTVKGIRYSDTQKKEVVDFAVAYNTTNGRGGQSQAAEKFKISALTVASWLKAAGAPASLKKTETTKDSKTAKTKSTSGKSLRYSDEQKQEIVDFAVAHNAANGRGGQSQAATKYGVSPLTVMAWLKGAGVKSSDKGGPKSASGKSTASKSSIGGNIDAKLSSLLVLSKQISKVEAELAQLNAKFKSLKASL